MENGRAWRAGEHEEQVKLEEKVRLGVGEHGEQVNMGSR